MILDLVTFYTLVAIFAGIIVAAHFHSEDKKEREKENETDED